MPESDTDKIQTLIEENVDFNDISGTISEINGYLNALRRQDDWNTDNERGLEGVISSVVNRAVMHADTWEDASKILDKWMKNADKSSFKKGWEKEHPDAVKNSGIIMDDETPVATETPKVSQTEIETKSAVKTKVEDGDTATTNEEQIVDPNIVTDADRAKFLHLPDEYIPYAKKVEAGGESPLRSEFVEKFYKGDGKYGLVQDDDKTWHLIDPDTGDTHDELRERQNQLAHRAPYERQTSEKDFYKTHFDKKSVQFEDLTLDQIKSQRRNLSGKSNDWKLQRFDDDAYVYNDKWRKLKSAEAVTALNDAKGIDTLEKAVQLAGHYSEIGGDAVPQSLKDALKEAKGRLADLYTSQGGLSGSQINKKWSVGEWAKTQPDETAANILASGGIFSSEGLGEADLDKMYSASDIKFVGGGKYNDGSMDELLGSIGMEGDTENYAVQVRKVIDRALDARSNYQEWRDKQYENYKEQKLAAAEHNAEVLSRGRKHDLIAKGEGYIIDEVEARKEADAEYAAAKAFVENAADENDYALMSPTRLKESMTSKTPTVLRLDHEKQTFTISNYDAENGILTVFDQNDLDAPNRLFRVTADDIKEIENDIRTKEDASGNVPADAQAQGGGVSKGSRAGFGEDKEGEEGGSNNNSGSVAESKLTTDGGRAYDALFGEDKDGFGARFVAEGNVASVVDDNYNVSQKAADDWAASCKGLKVGSSDDVARLCERISNPKNEIAKVLFLGDGGEIVGAVASVGLNGIGTLTTDDIVSKVPNGTRAVVISHNHPNGDTKPSGGVKDGDINYALKLMKKLSAKGISLLDSIVTDTNRHTSIANGSKWWPSVPEMRDACEAYFSGDQMIESPQDKFNVVPYEKRINLCEISINGVVRKLSEKIGFVDKDGSYVIGIGTAGVILKVVKVPTDLKSFGRILEDCPRIAVIVGNGRLDRNGIVTSLNEQFKGENAFHNDEELSKLGVVYVYDRIDGTEIGDGTQRVDKAFVEADKNHVINKLDESDKKSESKNTVLKKTSSNKSTVSSRLTGDTAKKAADALARFKKIGDMLKAPVAELEFKGGVGGIFTGSKRDYATKEDDRINNGPALFAVGSNTGSAAYGWGLYGSKRRDTAVNYAGGKDKGTIVEQTWFTDRAKGDESHLLKWSAPVSEANKKRIRDNWKAEFDESLPKTVQLTSGASAYRTLQKELGSDVEASMFLNRSGIDGVNSGDLYVTFSADNIRVDHKWKDGEQQYAPVEEISGELSKEARRELRNATEDLVEALQEAGMDDFESLVRYLAENDAETYRKLKPYLKNAYNSATDGDLSNADAEQIYGIIDKETANESATETKATGDTTSQREGEGKPVGDQGAKGTGRAGHIGTTGDLFADGSEDGSGNGVGQSDNGRGGVQQSGDESADDAGLVRGAGEQGGSGRGRSDVAGSDGGNDLSADRGESVGADQLQDGERTGLAEGEEVTPGFMRYKPPEDLPLKTKSSDSLIVETSAMASITPPKIDKKPNIPDEIVERGDLQTHQYHSVCQAVNAHERFLSDGRRYGYFCADGTGCGKTRIIAGVMTDAMRNLYGNGRCLIVSQKEDLFEDAKKDFAPFGIADRLLELDPLKFGSKSPLLLRGQGIAFTTYGRIADNYQGDNSDGTVKYGGKKKGCQFADIVKWLGGTNPEDYDGVIAFDEAHTASKDTGDSGRRTQMTRAQTVIDLQKRFPKARILYMTATAAYDANDLRFLERMGLWGKGTGFRDRGDFVSAFGRNGENVSLMEVMTQGLKARGLYCARSISYKGVKCDRKVHKLTPEQRETHDSVRRVLFSIHDAIPSACADTGAKSATSLMQFFGQSLRFFGSMMTSFKVGTAIELGRNAIDDGKCPVFQLIETGASVKQKKSKQSGVRHRSSLLGIELPGFEDNSDDAKASLRDKIINFLNTDSCFPTHEYLGKDEETGKAIWGDVVPSAMEMKERLVEMAKRIPEIGNPIDMLEDAFKVDGVSRVTGELPSEKRGEVVDAFNNGDNKVLIFSGAGGTGSSYHASPKFKNQRQRVQIPIEFGWEPDKFIQALGRSHRNNQVVPPEFWLLTTDLPGEMRFMSTIASRIASMGAIVGGDRNSSGQVVGASDSLDNLYGRGVIHDFGVSVSGGSHYAGVAANVISGEMMLSNDNLRKLDANKFLGRLQLLSFEDQKAIYDKISEEIGSRIDAAKAAGEYDDGIKKIDAKRAVVKGREALKNDDGSEANVDLLTIGEWNDSKRLSNDDFEKRSNGEISRITYARNKKSGNLFGFINGSDGKIRQYSPTRGLVGTVEPFDYRTNFDTVQVSAAKDEWNEKFGAAPAEDETETNYVTGDLFPVWNKIGVIRPFVVRGTPNNAKPFIGVRLVNSEIATALYGFGQKERARKIFFEKGFDWLKRGAEYGIGNSPTNPVLRIGTVNGKRSMMVVNYKNNLAVQEYLDANKNWESAWFKDSNRMDSGGYVKYIPLSNDGAEDAYENLVGKFGVVNRNNGKVTFASKDVDDNAPVRIEQTDRSGATGRVGGTFGERIGMPNMRITLNGDMVEFRPERNEWRHKNELKRALGGTDARRQRDGKSYVKSPDGMEVVKDGSDWYYTIPLEKITPEIRGELFDTQKATVEPVEVPVRDLVRDGTALENELVYDVLKAEVMPLATDNSRLEKKTNDELVKATLGNPNALAEIGELYRRYSDPTRWRSGGLPNIIRQLCGAYNPKETEIQDIESNVWNHPGDMKKPVDERHGGIIQELRAGHAEVFADGFEKALWSKARRFTKDFVVRGTKDSKRIVHTDAKSEQMNDSGTAMLIEQDIDNAGFVDKTVDAFGVKPRTRRETRGELAEILTGMEDFGVPKKYLTWLNRYLSVTRDLESEWDAANMKDWEDNYADWDAMMADRGRYVARNLMARLGKLGMRPEKLFEYEIGELFKSIRSWRKENDSRFLPKEEMEQVEYSPEDLIEIMEENGDERWADVCRLREHGMKGEEIARRLGESPDNVRQILHRAAVQYGYRYEGDRANGQTDWFDLLGVPGEITRTDKSAAPRKKVVSSAKQDDFLSALAEAAPKADEIVSSAESSQAQKVNDYIDEMVAHGLNDVDAAATVIQNVVDVTDDEGLRNLIKTKMVAAGIDTATEFTDADIAARKDAVEKSLPKYDTFNVDPDKKNKKSPDEVVKAVGLSMALNGYTVVDIKKKLVKSYGVKNDRATFIADECILDVRKNRIRELSEMSNVSESLFDVLKAEVATLAAGDGNRGFWNSEIDRFRSEYGMSPIKRLPKTSLDSIDRQGEAYAQNELEMLKKIDVWSNNPNPISPVEQSALDHFGLQKEREVERLVAQMKEYEQNGDLALSQEIHDRIYDSILPTLDKIQQVQKRVGREWGLAGRIRQLVFGPDMTLAAYMCQARKKAGGNVPEKVAEMASVIWQKMHDANLNYKNVQDSVAIAEQVVRAMKVVNSVNEEAKPKRRGAPTEQKIIDNYAKALLHIDYWSKKKGGVLTAIPNVHKIATDMMGYYYLTGEGYGVDGNPSVEKVVSLMQKDLFDHGVEADAWDIRQAITEMGKLSQPSKNEIEMAKRETRKQMLMAQQIAYFMQYGELPPKTGWEDIPDSDVLRELRRTRDRMFKDAKDKAGADNKLASALKRLKTSYRNKIDDINKKIEILQSGGTLPSESGKTRIVPDDELHNLINEKKAREDILKALDDPDGTKDVERRTVRLMNALSKHANELQAELDLAKAQVAAYAWDKDKKDPFGTGDPRIDALRQKIADIRKEKKELHDQLFPEGTVKEQEEYFARRKAELEKRQAVWEKAIIEANAATTTEDKLKALKPYGNRKQTRENIETLQAKKALDAAQKKAKDLLAQVERDNTNFGWGNVKAWTSFITTSPVILYTMLDLSVAGVQGGKQMLMHPKAWSTATLDGIKALFSEKAADDIVLDLNANPYTSEFSKHGGHLYKMDGLGEDGDIPEDFRALATGPKWFGGKTVDLSMIPGVKQSARSFAAFLNRLNVDVYRRIVEASSVDGPLTDYQKSAIAKFVNTSTGYGYSSTNRNAKNQEMLTNLAKAMECMAWAPRKVMGEIKFLTGVDMLEVALGTKKFGDDAVSLKDIARVEKIIGKEKFKFIGGMVALSIAAILASIMLGNDFDKDDFFDPTSSDFMMVKFGRTRIDVTRGLAKYIRTVARVGTGTKNINGVDHKISRGGEIFKFFASKSKPFISKGYEAVTGENIFGMPVNDSVGQVLKNFLMPITTSGLWDNFKANDPLTATALALPIFMGMTQYTETDYDSLNRPIDQGNAMKENADWLTERASGTMRAEAVAYSKAVKGLENIVKDNEKKILQLREDLKKAWKRTDNDAIRSEINALAEANEKINVEIGKLRPKAEDAVGKFKWPSAPVRATR